MTLPEALDPPANYTIHPKGRDNGIILTFCMVVIYVLTLTGSLTYDVWTGLLSEILSDRDEERLVTWNASSFDQADCCAYPS